MDCWNLELILEAFKNENVNETLELHEMSNSSFLLWPKPQIPDLEFLSDHLRRLGVSKVVSVGAGSGLFEWALESVSNVPCVALELDRAYWKSTRRPKFKDHIFTDDPELEILITDANNALLFSYFNDYNHFFKYLKRFTGQVLIIVGPEVKGRYCMPTPFDAMIPEEWKLSASKEISSTKDFISIYIRKK